MFSFTSFNGNSYDLPDLPDVFYEYEHFILVHSSSTFKIYAFNGNNISANIQGSGMYATSYYICDTPILELESTLSSSSWANKGFSSSVYCSANNYEVGYCSDRLLPFKDTLITRNFSIEIPEEVVAYTLRPIAEEQQDNFINVFYDIFDILPVLITVLVSFIGIRKGISWLSNLLRYS